MAMKKGFFFSVDALMAIIILALTILVFSKLYVQESKVTHIRYLSDDLMSVLSELKINKVNNSFVSTLIANGEIINTNHSLLEQVVEFYALNRTQRAQELIANVTEGLFPSNIGWNVVVDNSEIFRKDVGSGRQITAVRKMVSGYQADKPISGVSSRVYLSGIKNKRVASYAYFGGFVGQGNLSLVMNDIPSDAVVDDLYLEADAASNFTVYINQLPCGSGYGNTGVALESTGWNLSACVSAFVAGANNDIKLQFPGDISKAYVGGGFVRASYTTSQFAQTQNSNSNRELLPGITGIINLYSAILVPGTLNSITLYLHTYADTTNVSNTLYAAIANTTVLTLVNPLGESSITLSNLSSLLNFNALSSSTVPIRIGFENVSFSSVFEGRADIVTITDLSGSMDWRMDSSSTGTLRNCNDGNFTDLGTRRISVAKCLDMEFATSLLNVTGNLMGLVAFSDGLQSSLTVNLTTNLTRLNQTIGISVPLSGYSATGGTCICCGINGAMNILNRTLVYTTYFTRGSMWSYNDTSRITPPINDSLGRRWFEPAYDDGSWGSGPAILGYAGSLSYAPPIATQLQGSSVNRSYYLDLWENWNDTTGPPNDFSSGVFNSTANSYGLTGANDGWDFDTENNTGVFGYDDDMNYSVVGGMLTILNNQSGGSPGNTCTNNDCSGAFGILVNVTPEMYEALNRSKLATISFNYRWSPSGAVFETADQVWTKARWTSPFSGEHFLGSQRDIIDTGNDSDFEVATVDDPDTTYNGTLIQNITTWIEGAGMYYLELGGALTANFANEWGTWKFDDVQIVISNSTEYYYFRKHFNISDLNFARRAFLNVLSDNNAVVYVNGNLVDNDTDNHRGGYWSRHGRQISGSYLVQGENVIAAQVSNLGLAAKFDAEIIGVNSSRDQAMLVMTDGVANTVGTCPQQGNAIQRTISAACEAGEKYGIRIYAVGYSTEADEDTLRSIAACGDGLYTRSSNVTELQQFYTDVASDILFATQHAQSIEVQGEPAPSILFNDSYIEINYTPAVQPAGFGEIELTFEETNITNCSFGVSIDSNLRLTDARLTSYSADHWTDKLWVNSVNTYNLSAYNANYTLLGDPFVVWVPPNLLQAGLNNFNLSTGDQPFNSTGCSTNNTFIYRGAIKTENSYSPVLPFGEGCTWTVESIGGISTISVPVGYNDTNTCTYTQGSISYSSQDSLQYSMYLLLRTLDFNKDGMLDVDIDATNLQADAVSVDQVPYLWGPAIIEIRAWQ